MFPSLAGALLCSLMLQARVPLVSALAGFVRLACGGCFACGIVMIIARDVAEGAGWPSGKSDAKKRVEVVSVCCTEPVVCTVER